MENIPPRAFELEISASDRDDGNAGVIMDFQMLSSSTGFYIRETSPSGRAVISNYKSFDFEMEQAIEFHIIAIDRGSPTRVSEPALVHIDVLDENDNIPTFLQDLYSAAVPEKSVGYILTVFAVDRDRGSLTGAVVDYQLVPSTVPFVVSENGSISASDALDYDAFSLNEVPLYEFAVVASDAYGLSSRPAQVVVNIINENDNSPTAVYPSDWPVKNVVIEWGTPVSLSPIFTLRAIDMDRDDSLYFVLANTDKMEDLPLSLHNMASGDVILYRPLTHLTTYNITITVQDRHPLLYSADTRSLVWSVSVAVVDTNSPPYFSSNQLLKMLTLPEGEAPTQPVLQIVVLDDDYPGSLFAEIIEYRIVSVSSTSNGSTHIPFTVTPSGELTQTDSLSVATTTQYAFGIVAVDGGGLTTPEPMAITVQIEETNDFAPVISVESTSVTVYDDALPGDIVLAVNVNDEDEGVSGIFVCSFQEQSDLFEIDPISCDVTVKSELNYSSLLVTNHSLTITAADYGTPSLSDAVVINIAIIPAIVEELELRTNHSNITYTEESGPVDVLDEFELIQGTHNRPKYVARIGLTPGRATTPGQLPNLCNAGGNSVRLAECFPGFVSLLSTPETEVIFPTIVEVPVVTVTVPVGSDTIVFQTWLKTAHDRAESIVLLSGYPTTSEVDNTVFHIVVNHLSIGVRIGSFLQSGRSARLSDNTWHHILLAITPQAIQLYVDGQPPVYFESATLNIPRTMHLFVGRLKLHNYPEPFVGSLWEPSITFSQPSREHIPAYIFCSLSCGEALFTTEVDDGIVASVSSNLLEIRTQSFGSLTNALSGLLYNNTASEPAPHMRQVHISVSDGRFSKNITVAIHTLLVNEHTAVLDLNVESSGNVFFYVEPLLGPYPTRTTPNAIFSDGDTSQTDYTLRVDVIPPPRRLCDRLDYAVKVKLQECNSAPSLVMDLLPDYQWGLGTVIGVQSFYDYFLGYRFYGSGVFISDTSIYQNSQMNAHRFSFVAWLKLDSMGTVVHVVDKLQPFLFWLRVNNTMLESVHSFQAGNTHSLYWNWEPSNEWVHVAVIVDAPQIQVCVNGYSCQIQTYPSSLTESMLLNNLEAHVGALPDNGAYTDNFDGALSGIALTPNYTMTVATINCVVSCAEYIVISNYESSTGSALMALTETMSTGIASINGSLVVQQSVMQDTVQDFLQNVAYINTHPYPFPGERQVSYTVYDGSSEHEILGTSSLVVLYHGYRNLQLLRILRVTITANQLMYGVRPFESTGITTDARRDKIDSLLIELISRPQSSSTCLLGAQSDCPQLLHINPSHLLNSSLHIISKPEKLIVCGLSTVQHYQTLLREVRVQWAEPNAIVTSRSEFKLRVYISDMNGISSTTKTLTIQVQGIVRPQEDDTVDKTQGEEENGKQTEPVSATTESTATHKPPGAKSSSGTSNTVTCPVWVLTCILLAALISVNQ